MAATWYKTVSCVSVVIKFTSCAAESCIFVKETKGSWIFAALHVNELFYWAEYTGAINDVAEQLSSLFQIKMLGVFDTFSESKSSASATIDV